MRPEKAVAIEWRDAAIRLASRIEEMATNGQIETGTRQWLSLTENDLPRLDILRWLGWQQASVRFYWQDRNRQYEVAGLEAADIIHGKDSRFSAALLPPATGNLSYFGGCRFDYSYPESLRSDSWKHFQNSLCVLPLIQLQRSGDSYSISCNLDRTIAASNILSDITPELLHLSFDEEAGQVPGPGPYRRTDRPDLPGWTKNIESTLKMLKKDKAEKIVLARETTLEFEHDLNPWQILERLRSDASSCYLFGFQPIEGTAFIGASPERLYRRRQSTIETEAVAGTRPRGANNKEDLRFVEELLHSDKDRREHDLVAKSILDDLGELSLEINSDSSPSILKLSQVQHLYKKIKGVLKARIKDDDLLSRLHPTPAVGGLPRRAALEAIRTLEAFDRGWYAGPIGWLSLEAAEFAVGIRSGLVKDRTLTLYSGAGIVPGSTPENEWQEIEHKMSGFLEAVVGKQK